MTELPSNDYISQINQNGSGINIPQIVTAIVDAEITPVREPVVTKQARVAASISGLSQLKQAAELTNKNIANFKSSDISIETRSTDTDVLTVSVTDPSELQVGVSKITAITQLAQAHSHSIPAAGSARTVFVGAGAVLPEDYDLRIRFGTYNLTGTQRFTHDATTATTNIRFSAGESISAVAVKLDQIEGLNAKVVNTNANDYKIMITGETGLDNAFDIKTNALTFSHTKIKAGQTYTIVNTETEQIRANSIVNLQKYKIVSTDGDNEPATGIVAGRQYKVVSTDGPQANASTIDSGRWYKIVNTDSNAQSNATAIQNNAWYRVVSADSNVTTNATSIQAGRTYRVAPADVGDTVWANFGWNGSDAIFTATSTGNALSGTGKAIETTDFSRLNTGGNVGVGGTFKANVNAASIANVGPGRVIQYTNFSDYGTVASNQFKATQNALATVGPGKVIPFTNFSETFGYAGAAGAVFTAAAGSDGITNGNHDSGPGVVTSYTDFDTIYGGNVGSNAAGTIFLANTNGTNTHGTGKVTRFTDYNDYGHSGAALSNLTGNFVASRDGNVSLGSGTVTQVTGHDAGNNDYRIFDTWDDYEETSSLRTQDLNAKDIIFDLNGLEVKRETNIVTDVVPGASFEILKTSTIGAEIITGADKETLKKTVQSFIDEVNAYRNDLKALSRSDRTGGELGELYGNPYVKSRLRALSEFMLKPIPGYTSLDKTANGGSSAATAFTEASPVYLSQLGFKTQTDGTYGLDQQAFDTTFNNAPGNFDALTKDHAFSKHPEITVIWDGNEDNTPAGIYEFHHADDDRPFGSPSDGNVIYSREIRGGYDQKLYRSTAVGGVYTYSDTIANSTGDFPGLSLRVSRDNLGNDVPMNVHLGKSFATRFAEFHDDILNNTYIHRRQVQNVELQNEMLLKRIAQLDLRKNTLAQTYNKQFQQMEEMVTGFKSTGSYLTSMVDSWNKK